MFLHAFRQATRLTRLLLGPALALLLVYGCTSRGTPYERSADEPLIGSSEAGQVIGGVVGAAAGSQVGSGSGQTVATVAGALLGSVVGERIGARMEQDDRRRTARALDSNDYGETSRWENDGTEYAVTPEERWRDDDGRICREFNFRVETARGTDLRERVACRQPDGSWDVVA